MKAIILLGAPGVGKGTVAEDIKGETGYVHISTGDMLREAVKAGRPVGLEAKVYMDRGELVPDEVIMKIVTERLDRGPQDAKYMFDGFPRTPNQARLLDDVLAGHGSRIDHVFLLDVPREILIRRIVGRRVCRQCGAVYNIPNMLPKVKGICDHCGGELYHRPDDNEAIIVNRLEVYANQTSSLIDHYAQKGVLRRVDSTDRIETEEKIMTLLAESR